VTEIPEHLLKRSKAARAQAEGDAAPTEGAATEAASSATPATPASAAPAAAPATPTPAVPAGPPPTPPDIPVVAAAKARKKIPFWAFATLSTLPLWAFMYVRALTPSTEKIAGPLGEGATVYSGAGACSGCHGGAGEGGVGYAFAQGEVLKTFPHIEDQLRWVDLGSDEYAAAGVQIYGDPNRAGGPHITKARGAMPAQAGQLTEAEILAVVCHERYTLGGADLNGAYATEYANWCAPDAPAWLALEDGSATFDNIDTKVTGAIKVGKEPAAGSSASS
jgi:mono/diheme cytochrome c family protein